MKIHLDNYNLSCRESLFVALTLTGGTLVKRHWCKSSEEMPIYSKWGHRIVALIEAVPLLGGLVTLIEIVVVKCLCKRPNTSSHSERSHPITTTPHHLEFNTPTILTCAQVLMLKICSTTHKSALPEYKGSIFKNIIKVGTGYVITRQKMNEPPPLNGMLVPITSFIGPKEVQSNEGLKVRTFCLKLLSNIEDLQIAKQNPLTYEPQPGTNREDLIRAAEIKNVVKYFLELGALQKKAGFSDFVNLINVLTKGAPEFAPIFSSYSDLIEVQKKLTKKVKERVSRWDKIKTMVHSGLFVSTLVETAEFAKKNGLHPIPALPKQQTFMNLYPTIDAINLLESKHREGGRWLMHHTKMITFHELCLSIKASCAQLRDLILDWDDYYLLSVAGKSQEWMADIAYRYLPIEKMPKGVLTMRHHSPDEGLFDQVIKSGSNNFILFDDGAYSLRQFSDYLASLYEYLEKIGPLNKKKNIYFIFGHFPHDKYREASFKGFEEYNVNIKLISNHLTKNCHTLMEEENLTPSIKQQIKDLASTERPQLTTEWKKPDFMSTSLFTAEGYLGKYSRARYGELNVTEASIERLHGIGPIVSVTPPYKK